MFYFADLQLQGYAFAAIAQLGERQTEDLKVPGSIPGGGTALVAQLVEHGSNKPRVGGSSPSWSIDRSYSVMVITKDSDSFNPGSSPGRTFLFWWSRMVMLFIVYPGATILPSLWPNWIRRLTTNQKIGGSSPSRDIFYFFPTHADARRSSSTTRPLGVRRYSSVGRASD